MRPFRKGKKNLLVMDSHNSRTFNFQFMKLMNDNNVVVLAFPPHTTHAMQPLNDIPFTNFKMTGIKLCANVCASMSGLIFVPCWRKTITVKNIQAGF